MTIELETRLGEQFNEIGKDISDKKPLSSDLYITRILRSVFHTIHWDAYYKEEKRAVLKMFDVKWDPENVESVSIGKTRDLAPIVRLRHDAKARVVEIGMMHPVILTPVEKFEPVMEWVDIDENHRERRPVLDKDQKPKMKKLKPVAVQEQRLFVYHFPITFFADLFTEIGVDNLTEVPADYIPEPLGGAMMELFSRAMGSVMLDNMMMDSWGSWGPGPFTPKMVVSHHHPKMRRNGFGQQITPFRVFLKPEPGSDRMEVQFEPYPEEEIMENAKLITNRKEWANGNVSQTSAVRALKKKLEGFIKEARKELYAKKPDEQKQVKV
jgi:hypothetical protein